MIPFQIFDCACSIGPRMVVEPGSFTDADTLLTRMDSYHIEKALVWHTRSKEEHPVPGNADLLRELEGKDRLLPVFTVMPNHTGEFIDPKPLVSKLKSLQVKAVNLFPATHGFSIADYSCGELFTELEKAGIALFLSYEELTGSDEPGSVDCLYHLCKTYPRLKVVLTNLSYRLDRYLFPILKSADNLYLESYGYKSNNGVKEICERFGAKHLIFGSGMPIFSAPAAQSLILYADISNQEKEMIFSKNLEELLEVSL